MLGCQLGPGPKWAWAPPNWARAPHGPKIQFGPEGQQWPKQCFGRAQGHDHPWAGPGSPLKKAWAARDSPVAQLKSVPFFALTQVAQSAMLSQEPWNDAPSWGDRTEPIPVRVKEEPKNARHEILGLHGYAPKDARAEAEAPTEKKRAAEAPSREEEASHPLKRLGQRSTRKRRHLMMHHQQ